MNSLTKIEGNEIVTDSRDLEEVFGIQHRSIYRLIVKHEVKLGKVRFEITANPSGQKQSYAILNEEQAILLLTYTRSNEKTDKYRRKLVSDFLRMRDYIRNREAVRIASIEARKELTDIVKDSGEDERMHGHAYSNYTNLVYDVCGLREKYKTWKKYDSFTTITFRDFIKPEELKRVKLAESLIKPLLELEKEYSEIKETIKPLFEVKF